MSANSISTETLTYAPDGYAVRSRLHIMALQMAEFEYIGNSAMPFNLPTIAGVAGGIDFAFPGGSDIIRRDVTA